MKGQLAVEELISLAIYLALIYTMVSAVSGFGENGREWGKSVVLGMEAESLAHGIDAFSIHGVYGAHAPFGGGSGYIELKDGELEASAPLSYSKTDKWVAVGEPV